jgi:hypothetical protein
VRPDVVAFRELDALVRNLTDQLAGYRRRALSSEARTRDLEQEVVRLEAALAAAKLETAGAVEAREHALAAAREATAVARAAKEALTELERVPVMAAPDAIDSPDATAVEPVVGTRDAIAENERLRLKLREARDKTAQLADRVRFLRQQLTQGAER